jgi:hypothetical protein
MKFRFWVTNSFRSRTTYSTEEGQKNTLHRRYWFTCSFFVICFGIPAIATLLLVLAESEVAEVQIFGDVDVADQCGRDRQITTATLDSFMRAFWNDLKQRMALLADR